MVKKRNLEYLLNNVPSPNNTSVKIVSMLFAVLMFSVLIYVGSVTYTGLAISELDQPTRIIRNQNIELNEQFEVLDITKSKNSVLNINVESDVSINIFAEINDCSYWKNGDDKDNTILYAVNNIKEGTFKIGDPSENTMQQVDLYKTSDLCLIFVNRQHPVNGNVKFGSEETDNNKWRII